MDFGKENSTYLMGRMVTGFSDQAKDIGECANCQKTTSLFVNCDEKKVQQANSDVRRLPA